MIAPEEWDRIDHHRRPFGWFDALIVFTLVTLILWQASS